MWYAYAKINYLNSLVDYLSDEFGKNNFEYKYDAVCGNKYFYTKEMPKELIKIKCVSVENFLNEIMDFVFERITL